MMNRLEFVASTLAGVIGLTHASQVAGQAKPEAPDLRALAATNSLKLFNRSATPVVDGGRNGVRLSQAAGEGGAFLPGIAFSSGTIELDVRGKDIAQQSFVG